MCGVTPSFNDVNSDIKENMIKEMKTIPDNILIKGDDQIFKRGDKREIYFAVRNNNSKEIKFNIDANCISSIKEGTSCKTIDCTMIKLRTFSTVQIKPKEINIMKLAVSIDINITPDTYICALYIIDSNTSTEYTNRVMYLTIE